MTGIKQILVFACIIVSVAMISGCTMSDSEVQAYIDNHPEEISQYVSSHGEMISSYLAEHPEILEAIELPEATVTLAVEPQTYRAEVTETQSPTTESPTVVIQSTTTTIPTETQPTTPTVTDTPEVTTVPTTVPTTEVTTTIQTTVPTTIPTTEVTTEVTTDIPTTIPTASATTIPTTVPTTEPTPVPTPTPYISTVTGQPAIVDVNGPWTLVSNQDGIRATMTVSLNYNSPSYTGVDTYNGVATISGEANNAAIKREDGNPVGVGSLHGTDFSYQFTWHDNLDGTYSTSSIVNPLDWSDKAARTITYSISGTSEKLHFSGWPEGTYLTRG